jgi:hypothetical protein
MIYDGPGASSKEWRMHQTSADLSALFPMLILAPWAAMVGANLDHEAGSI